MKQDIIDKLKFIAIVFIIIGSWSILNHYLYDLSNNAEQIKWLASTDESLFQQMKLPVIPWVVCTLVVMFIRRTKYGPLYFMRNKSSSMFGLLLTLATIPSLYFLYTQGINKDQNEIYDILIFFASLFMGILLWSFTSSIYVDPQIDILLVAGIMVGLVTWFSVCSYKTCSNIYDERI